jgi:hypothetical protein
MEVAVTDASGLDFDEHFARPRRVELGVFYREWSSALPENRRPDLHSVSTNV